MKVWWSDVKNPSISHSTNLDSSAVENYQTRKIVFSSSVTGPGKSNPLTHTSLVTVTTARLDRLRLKELTLRGQSYKTASAWITLKSEDAAGRISIICIVFFQRRKHTLGSHKIRILTFIGLEVELTTHVRKNPGLIHMCEAKTFFNILDGCRWIASLVALSRGLLLCHD